MLRRSGTVGPEAGNGTSGFAFRVGGVGIELRTEGFSIRLDPQREPFRYSDGRPDISLDVRVAALGSRPPGHLLFDSGAVWRAYDDRGERVFRFSSPFFGPEPYKELRVNQDSSLGEIVLHEPYRSSDLMDPLEYPLDELLVVNKLGMGLGCELHACGIVDEEGRGWIFCGHSGAGKSTMAQLLSGRHVTVLSDDRIILREAGDEVLMYGTPWHGEAGFAVAASAPLAGILILSHGTSNRTVAMTRVEAVSELMARAFVPFHDEGALETAVTTFNAALDVAASARFAFVPDHSAVDHVFAWMKEAGRG